MKKTVTHPNSLEAEIEKLRAIMLECAKKVERVADSPAMTGIVQRLREAAKPWSK